MGVGGAAGGTAAGGTAAGGAATGGAGPRILSIDFLGGQNGPTGNLVSMPAMAATEVAGFKPAANWIGASGLTGSVAALAFADGSATAASVAWNAPVAPGTTGIWHIGYTDAPGDTRMMNGYLDPSLSASPGTITVSGLPASVTTARYDVYVYTLGDIPYAATRAYKYTIGALSFTVSQTGPTPLTFSGYKLAPAGGSGNYIVFKNLSGASFTLTATPAGTELLRAPVNGIQIVSPTGS
jgi:hypothetical protein